jgi:RNA-directed DNA polymerase
VEQSHNVRSGKSDDLIVSMKEPNKVNRLEYDPIGRDLGHTPTAESLERRGSTKGNMLKINSHRTQRRARLQQDLEHVRKLAEQDKSLQFTSIWHLVYNVDRLYEAYQAIKSQSAPGIDGQTKEQYGENIDENLADLSSRLARGAYHAKPVKRVYIPKSDGKLRPIGVPALEDKIVQRATAEVLQAIYEADFRDLSFGFRPGRNQHQALDSLAVALERRRLNWVLDADIRGFFDNIDHERLMQFIKHRIGDKRVWRHIQKWLQAGVLERGEITIVAWDAPISN